MKIQIIIIIFILIGFIIISYLWMINGGIQIEEDRDFGCYKSHVRECLDCHSRNLTYALCSGFCFEPRESDLNNTMTICSVHPLEDCFDLPKECNLR